MKRINDPSRLAAWLLVGLAVCWRVGDAVSRSLWFDEAFSWQLTRFPWREMFARAEEDVHPPLYYVVLKLWTGLLGDSLIALRMLSVAWFAAALAGAYLFCREASAGEPRDETAEETPERALRDGDTGLIAMLLLATSPFLYRFSQEVRMYAQEVALLTLGSWLLLRALRERARPGRWWFAYGVTAAALAYTHYFGIFSLAAQGCYVVATLVREYGWRGLLFWRLATGRFAAVSALLATALFCPWLPVLEQQQANVSEDYWISKVEVHSPLDLRSWGAIILKSIVYDEATQISVSDRPGWDGPAVSAMLIGAVAIVLGLLARWGGRAGWYLIAGVVIPVLLAIIKSYRMDRDLIELRFLMPSFVMLLIGLAVVIGAVRSRVPRFSLALLATVNLAIFTGQYRATLDLPHRPESRGMAHHIVEQLQGRDLVLCTSPSMYFPMKYHARGRFEVKLARYPGLFVSHYSGAPILQESDYVMWDDVVRARDRRVWVIAVVADKDAPRRLEGWTLVQEQVFQEAIQWRGSSALSLWEAPAAAPPLRDSPAGAPRPTTAEARR